jgi:hypothetical protein
VPPTPKIDLHYFETKMKEQLAIEAFAFEKTYLEFQEILLDVESIGMPGSALVVFLFVRLFVWFVCLRLLFCFKLTFRFPFQCLGRTAESGAVKRVMLRWFDALKLVVERELLRVLEEYQGKEAPSDLETEIVKFWTLVPTQKLTIMASHQLLAVVYDKVGGEISIYFLFEMNLNIRVHLNRRRSHCTRWGLRLRRLCGRSMLTVA